MVRDKNHDTPHYVNIFTIFVTYYLFHIQFYRNGDNLIIKEGKVTYNV